MLSADKVLGVGGVVAVACSVGEAARIHIDRDCCRSSGFGVWLALVEGGGPLGLDRAVLFEVGQKAAAHAHRFITEANHLF